MNYAYASCTHIDSYVKWKSHHTTPQLHGSIYSASYLRHTLQTGPCVPWPDHAHTFIVMLSVNHTPLHSHGSVYRASDPRHTLQMVSCDPQPDHAHTFTLMSSGSRTTPHRICTVAGLCKIWHRNPKSSRKIDFKSEISFEERRIFGFCGAGCSLATFSFRIPNASFYGPISVPVHPSSPALHHPLQTGSCALWPDLMVVGSSNWALQNNILESTTHVPHVNRFAVILKGSHISRHRISAVQRSVASFMLDCIPGFKILQEDWGKQIQKNFKAIFKNFVEILKKMLNDF